MTMKATALILLAALAASCGGGSAGPTGPGGTPTPTPPPGSAVTGFVFYDENGNGTADPSETVRLPGVGVVISGVTTSTVEGGRFSFSSVPNGAQTAQASPASLPAYFTPGSPLSVGVPASGDVPVPAVLPIGSRSRPNLYLAFGDSITYGDGSSDGGGYRDELRADLRAYWGKADITNDGAPGTKSNKGETRVGASLGKNRPAYLLILYGTNDWNDTECKNEFPCYTIDSLRSMAKQERAPVAEVHGAFLKQSSLPPLFDDFIHPNDDGYRVISRAFFDAITKPMSTTASGRAPAFFFETPPGS